MSLFRMGGANAAELATLCAAVLLTLYYSWLLDDAYIYFRYVDNWVVFDQGLVFNSGEYVEGFSSPFWVWLLGGLRALQLNYLHIVNGVGLACCGLLWWLAVVVNRKLIPGELSGAGVFNLPLLYLLLNYGVVSYLTSGVETPLVLVMGAAFAAAIVLPANVLLQVVVGLAPVIRHELFLPFGLMLGWYWFANRRVPWAAIVACGVTLGGYVLFRVWYYADLFPLTFYLKNDQLWSQGFAYMGDTFLTYFMPLYLFVGVALCLFARRFYSAKDLRITERVAMVVVALPVLIYVVRIGGDGRHLRYLAFPFVLLALSAGGLFEVWVAHTGGLARRLAPVATGLFAAGVLYCYPPQLSVHPLRYRIAGAEHEMVNDINDAAWHRTAGWEQPFWQEELPPARWDFYFKSSGALDWSSAYNRYQQADVFGEPRAESWCKTGYLMAPAYITHSLGLTEPYLARARVPVDRPGHKYALETLGEELLRIRMTYGIRRGALHAAMADGYGQHWLAGNEHAISEIDRRVFNRHDFAENLKLALSPSPWLTLSAAQLAGDPASATRE